MADTKNVVAKQETGVVDSLKEKGWVPTEHKSADETDDKGERHYSEDVKAHREKDSLKENYEAHVRGVEKEGYSAQTKTATYTASG